MAFKSMKGAARSTAGRMRTRSRKGYMTPLGRLMKMQGGAVASRVHVFKRLGQIIRVQGNGGAGILINGAAPGALNLQTSVPVFQASSLLGCQQFGLGLGFTLNNISNVTDITSLFDNYRIKSVRLRFDFSYNQAPSSITAGEVRAVPKLHYTPDYDTSVGPSTITEVLESGYAKTARLDKTVYVTVYPRFQNGVAVAGGSGAAVGGGLGARDMWLSKNSPDVLHSGLRCWFEDTPTGGSTGSPAQFQWQCTITPTYIVEARNSI